MADALKVEKQTTLDLLDIKQPATSSTSDMPVIETKPDVTVPKKDAEVEAAEVLEEPAPSEQPAPAADDKPKKAQGVQKRIDELTRQREDERRRAEAAEARELRILSALEKATGTPKEPKQDIEEKEPVRPRKTDFTDPDQYDQAVDQYVTERAAWIAKREVKSHIEAQERKAAETQAQAQQRLVQESFRKRAEETSKKYSDYHEVAESPDVQVSFPMAYAILQSEQGPEIQYYLGKNPDEAKRISSMNTIDQGGNSVPDVARQLVELGIIAARLSQPAVKPVSQAPSPGKPIKAGETATVKSLEELDSEGMEAYAARRKPELMARKGPGARA